MLSDYCCPACFSPALVRMDKHGRPYLRCGSGCRFFTTGPSALGGLRIVSDMIRGILDRMQQDPEYRERMRAVVAEQTTSLRAALGSSPIQPISAPETPLPLANTR